MNLTPEKFNAMVAQQWPNSPLLCEEITETTALVSLNPTDTSIRPGGFISGPMQFTAADMGLWVLAALVRDEPVPMAMTSDLAIRYLRPAAGKKLYARATANKLSSRTVIGSVSIWMDDNEDKPCAIAQGTYVLPPEK